MSNQIINILIVRIVYAQLILSSLSRRHLSNENDVRLRFQWRMSLFYVQVYIFECQKALSKYVEKGILYKLSLLLYLMWDSNWIRQTTSQFRTLNQNTILNINMDFLAFGLSCWPEQHIKKQNIWEIILFGIFMCF